MFCIAIILRLRSGCLGAYRNAHERIWPEVAQSMNDNNVRMAIFHYQGQLLVFSTAPSEQDWKRSRAVPALAKWNKWMTEFVESTPAGEIVFDFPEKVFEIGMSASSSRMA